MSDPAPKRRWFRFSLRTLLVITALFGVWLGYNVNWMRQRREFIVRHNAIFQAYGEDWRAGELHTDFLRRQYPRAVRAPWPLWLFGEPGVVRVNVAQVGEEPGAVYSDDYEAFQDAKRLFPEALNIVLFGMPDQEDALDPLVGQ